MDPHDLRTMALYTLPDCIVSWSVARAVETKANDENPLVHAELNRVASPAVSATECAAYVADLSKSHSAIGISLSRIQA